jgi:hypothetical protein
MRRMFGRLASAARETPASTDTLMPNSVAKQIDLIGIGYD